MREEEEEEEGVNGHGGRRGCCRRAAAAAGAAAAAAAGAGGDGAEETKGISAGQSLLGPVCLVLCARRRACCRVHCNMASASMTGLGRMSPLALHLSF